MIFLNPNSDKIICAKELHVEQLTLLLKNRVERLRLNPAQKSFLRQLLNDQAKNILEGLPKQLKQLSDGLNFNNIQKHAISSLFNYSGWFCKKNETRYDAYDLANNLNVNTCVYCNRNYTSTVIGVTRPQFDHYFSQKRHRILALSFYNLIPCCSICNSTIKGERELNLVEHLHPYVDECLNDFRFSYDYDIKESLAIKLKYSRAGSKAENTFNFFKTKEVYNAHADELKDLLRLRESFSDKYLEILSKKVLEGIKISKSELYQLAFGVYSNENEFSKRPFSKFKNDILIELGILSIE